ncbi:MAG: hypothetical protein QF415_13430 [Candidatus Undinarchaeales archaeon]|jgi:hypothetical protein|nr:hypothetical protein [Candidatus Undinarchaeales archaeon]MDP7494479.1 hypothetical protein [Candidatus Undinarchaeales archaeon]
MRIIEDTQEHLLIGNGRLEGFMGLGKAGLVFVLLGVGLAYGSIFDCMGRYSRDSCISLGPIEDIGSFLIGLGAIGLGIAFVACWELIDIRFDTGLIERWDWSFFGSSSSTPSLSDVSQVIISPMKGQSIVWAEYPAWGLFLEGVGALMLEESDEKLVEHVAGRISTYTQHPIERSST